MQKKTLVALLYTLAFIMLLNAAISGYVYYQKQAILAGKEVGDVCFASTGAQGGCADVQFSEYGTIFGVSVSLLGLILFTFMAIVLASLAYSLKNQRPIKTDADLNFTRKFCLYAFLIALVGAVYFITLQLFVINIICKYCMVIDTLTIISSITYIATFKSAISFFLE